jgi:threonine/homoserine/homoserine lactone efflux protein
MFEGITQLPLFIAAGLLLNITPGADMALVASRAATGGWRAGAAAALGVGAGCGVHIGAAALGLSALLAASPWGLAPLRWLGAAYLVWLGIVLLRSGMYQADQPAAAVPGAPPEAGRLPLRRMFAQGFFTNALNPKVALFFLAFVPQFIDPRAPRQALAFVVLGLVFVVNSTLVNLGVAAAVAQLARRLAGQPRWPALGRWLNCGVGALFVALGGQLAFEAWTGGR